MSKTQQSYRCPLTVRARHPATATRPKALALTGILTGTLVLGALWVCVSSTQLLAAGGTATMGTDTGNRGFTVQSTSIDDMKAVFATVQSSDKISARSRVSGTVASLSVDEGSQVKRGDVVAIIADQKIALRLAAIDARILALKSRANTKEADLERSQKLKDKGIISQARFDNAETAFEVAKNELKSVRAERSVIEKQGEEGNVLAPADGRVLLVPVTKGSVVLPGEAIATIAANRYILRLEIPERHARFLTKGGKVFIGHRGLEEAVAAPDEGTISQVYPQLQKGRVVADAQVKGLGSYFVGERALVWVLAGKRNTIVIPGAYTFRRYGLDYVKLDRGKKPPLDIVVQLGQNVPVAAGLSAGGASASKDKKDFKVEVLSGLKDGDRLVKP